MSRITLDDLMAMDRADLHRIMARAHPLDRDALADTQYQGIDLGMPAVFHKLMWKTFRKTFHRDETRGMLRGWNVRMEQHGVDGPAIPKQRKGRDWTFGHYVVADAAGHAFPRDWSGQDFLDYRGLGNPGPEGWGYCPLVAVNEGDMELLLGWEVFKVGPARVPLPDHWVLRREGPLEQVVPPPAG